jgi:alcohol dehydrogenase class IV
VCDLSCLKLGMNFEFATAGRVLFGPGTLLNVGPAARSFGQRALVVKGRSTERVAPLLKALDSAGVAALPLSIDGEPSTAIVGEGARLAREKECDLVIAMGGGSVVDAGKAVAALATNSGEALDYLEVVGQGKPLQLPPLPFIAIPTTAGTGAEVTHNAVLLSRQHRVKVSLRSPLLRARLAVVDPELTVGMDFALTAATGLDALTQLIEPFVSCRANAITDGFCREGMVRAARSLQRACDNPKDLAAREDMALASLLSGLALANAGLGAVHGFAAPIGGMFDAPHGAVCAALLPHVMEMNLHAICGRQPQNAARARYDEVARLLTCDPSATGSDGVAWVRQLCAALRIPPLGRYGLTQDDIASVCEKASHASSMKGNPLPLLSNELEEILSGAL